MPGGVSQVVGRTWDRALFESAEHRCIDAFLTRRLGKSGFNNVQLILSSHRSDKVLRSTAQHPVQRHTRSRPGKSYSPRRTRGCCTTDALNIPLGARRPKARSGRDSTVGSDLECFGSIDRAPRLAVGQSRARGAPRSPFQNNRSEWA